MHSDILAELYRQYYSSALLYVLSLCRDRALAEEIVHDAFAKAYLSLPDDVPSFPFWLMKVCRNLFYDHARRQKFLTDAPVPEGTNLNSPETLLLQKEEAAALWRAIGKLDAADRELLALQADHKEQVWIWSAALAWEVTRPMQLSLAGGGIGWGETVNEGYPLLRSFDVEDFTVEDWRQHFESQLRYLADHGDPLWWKFDSYTSPEQILNYYEQEGLIFKGLWVVGTGEALLSLYASDVVGDIWGMNAYIAL